MAFNIGLMERIFVSYKERFITFLKERQRMHWIDTTKIMFFLLIMFIISACLFAQGHIATPFR
jgi:hypothetical protein